MFKASALEFRLRYYVHAVIFAIGFGLRLDRTGANPHTWGILAANLSEARWMGIDAAFNLLLAVAIVLAVAGAWLRTWGGAYLGADVVQDGAMHTADSPTPFAGPATRGVLTDGPYRHLRNPLYVGTFLHTLALALLMPRWGAMFAIVAIGVVQVRLILGEEAFLLRTIGAPYAAYCSLVPRLWPALRGKVAAGGRVPRWGQAFLGETYFWIVAGAFAFVGWQYNAFLLMQCVLVAFGASMVVKALTKRPVVAG